MPMLHCERGRIVAVAYNTLFGRQIADEFRAGVEPKKASVAKPTLVFRSVYCIADSSHLIYRRSPIYGGRWPRTWPRMASSFKWSVSIRYSALAGVHYKNRNPLAVTNTCATPINPGKAFTFPFHGVSSPICQQAALPGRIAADRRHS